MLTVRFAVGRRVEAGIEGLPHGVGELGVGGRAGIKSHGIKSAQGRTELVGAPPCPSKPLAGGFPEEARDERVGGPDDDPPSTLPARLVQTGP